MNLIINVEKKYTTKGYFPGGVDYVTKPVDPDVLLIRAKTFYHLYEQNSILNEMQMSLKKEIEYRKAAQLEAQLHPKERMNS